MKTFSRTGMTLIELIVASVLVGIVTMGLIAAEQSTRLSRQSSTRDNQLTTALQAMALAMTKDANMTTGDYASTGLWEASDVTNTLIAICFRHDVNDPNVYTDDKWNCWTWDRTGTGNIYNCRNQDTPPASNQCPAGSMTWNFPKLTSMGITVQDDGSGTTFSSGTPGNGYIIKSHVTGIRIVLQGRYDKTIAVDPIINPTYAIDTIVNPPGLGR